MKNFLGTLILGVALTAPVAAQAVSVRIYDKGHKDYHVWNDNEDKAHRRWLEERHEQNREWRRENTSRQRDYWKWRHEHNDAVLFPR